MPVRFVHRDRHYEATLDGGTSLAIELDFDGDQPGCFGAGPARARPLKAGDFVVPDAVPSRPLLFALTETGHEL